MSSFPASEAIDSSIVVAPLRQSERPLRIALLGYRSHPHVGGQGIYLRYLSKALAARGHHVDVFSGPPYPELDDGVNLIKVPSLDLYSHPNPHRALRLAHLKSFTDVYEWWSKLSGGFGEPYCFGRRIAKYFKQHKPHYDIVHDNQSLASGLLSLERQGYTLVETIHHPITQDRELAIAAASSRGHKWLVSRWYSFIDMQITVARRLRNIVTVSSHSQKDIATDFGISPQHIRVIGNGVDTSVFRPLDVVSDDYQIITTASSDQPLKGLQILLNAFAALRVRIPRARLLVIGKLNPEGDTAKQLQALSLGDAVQFVSGISTDELVRYYGQSALAVVPSLYEGFGLPAAEALACGKPLIVTDGGALPEVVGDAALIVKAGDASELADAMYKVLSEPALRAQLAQLARVHSMHQLSWDRVAQTLETYYLELLQK